ncbi:MAG: adenylate kinase [Rhodobacteraceae bacterium]|nr:adenylate kinase [Paracoccaceae bacterium]
MNLILLGPPGSGKGTQAKILVQSANYIQLSTGDILRESRQSGTKLGREVAAVMDAGDLVTDEIVIALIEEKLTSIEGQDIIFDGFPRTLPQADALDDLMHRMGSKIDLAIELTVDSSKLIERIIGRISCPNCGAMYHLTNNPPKVEGVCDHCGRILIQRPDDNEESFRTRLLEYYSKTAPLTGYYYKSGILKYVTSEGSIKNIAQTISELL